MDPTKLFSALIAESLTEVRDKNVSFFVDCLDHTKKVSLSETKDLKPIVSFVNASLNEPSARVEGLQVLNVIVEQCSTETFAQHHVQWIQGVRKVVISDPNAAVRVLAASILVRILTHASQFPEFVRNLATSVVPQFLQSVLANDDNGHSGSTFRIIGSFLKFFPGSCRQHIAAIKRKIFVLLFSDNREVVELAASCLSMIPYVGGIGGAKMDRETNWTKLYAQLLGSVHQVLNSIYEKLEAPNGKVDPVEQVQFDFVEILDHDPVLRYLYLCRQSIGFLVTIRKMLTSDGHDPRLFLTVPIEDTLLLMCRVFNTNGRAEVDGVQRNQPQVLILLSFLPIIHNEAVRVLIDLLLTCRRHLCLHGTPILQVVRQSLDWTALDDRFSETGHPLANLRASVYELFVTWMETAHSPGGLRNVELPLVNQMLVDVVPPTHSVLLDPGLPKSKPGQSKRKKAKKDFGSIASVDVVHRKSHPWANSELCQAALKALKALFYFGAEDLRARSLVSVHGAVLKLAFDIQSLVDMPTPYGDPRCRSAVYRLLLATVIAQHPRYVPEVSTSIEIFSRGVTDGSPVVSEACVEALAVCQMMINPRRRPMHFLASCLVTDRATSDSDSELDLTAVSDDMENEEDEETEPVAVDGFRSVCEETAVINGRIEVTEELEEVIEVEDSAEQVDCPPEEDRATEKLQVFVSKMDVDSDCEEIEMLDKSVRTGSDYESSKPARSSPITSSSIGAEVMLMSFVDAQPD